MGRNWIEIKLNLEEETTNFLCNDNESLNEEKKNILNKNIWDASSVKTDM